MLRERNRYSKRQRKKLDAVEEPLPLYDTLFELTVSLCDRFPAYTPTSIRETRAREVFLMVNRLNKSNKNNKTGNAIKPGSKTKGIRRPAGDNWF